MTNYRESLRLHNLGLNKTEIASSCRCARNTVAATLQRAANCGLQWPLPEEMSDKQLSERLFPTSPYGQRAEGPICRFAVPKHGL